VTSFKDFFAHETPEMTRKEESRELIYKAVSALVDEHRAQVLNYLSATGCKLGLLVNFGHYPRIEYERLLPKKHEPVDFHL